MTAYPLEILISLILILILLTTNAFLVQCLSNHTDTRVIICDVDAKIYVFLAVRLYVWETIHNLFCDGITTLHANRLPSGHCDYNRSNFGTKKKLNTDVILS